MEAQVITKIKELVERTQRIELDGKTYVPQQYQILRHVDRIPPIRVSTLDSLIQFVVTNPHKIPDIAQAIAVIEEDMSVQVLSLPNPVDLDRSTIIEAKSIFDLYRFNVVFPSTVFNILLQTRFVYDEHAMNLFGIVSKLHIDEGVELSDDGMSTKVTVRKGMSSASLTSVAIPSRVELRPFRIFPEVEQPSSQFLVRMEGDKDSGASIGLWETDGGLWKLVAKRIIKRYLIENGFPLPVFA